MTLPNLDMEQYLPGIYDSAKWFVGEYSAYILIGFAVALAMAIMAGVVSLFEPRQRDDEDDFDLYA